MNEYLRPKQVCDILNTTPRTISQWRREEKSNTLLQKEDNIVIPFNILLPPRKTPIKKTTVIVEYHQEDKLTTSDDKLNSSNQDILTTQLSEILDKGLILKEKELKPFWTKQSEEISRKLWLPTKTDYQDLVLTCSKVSSLYRSSPI